MTFARIGKDSVVSKTRVVVLQNGLVSYSHVAVVVLLAQIQIHFSAALIFQLLVKHLLLLRRVCQHGIHVHFPQLLPLQLGLLDQIPLNFERCLGVLHQHVSVQGGVHGTDQVDFMRQLVIVERLLWDRSFV